MLPAAGVEDVGDQVPRGAGGWGGGAVPDGAQGPAQVQAGGWDLDELAG
jgi:hypothetical protein